MFLLVQLKRSSVWMWVPPFAHPQADMEFAFGQMNRAQFTFIFERRDVLFVYKN